MRKALVLMSGVIAACTMMSAAADRATASVSRPDLPRVGQAAAVQTVNHRRWHVVPTSPYYSAGYPRLYYYPWGLRPHTRWHRWGRR